MRGFPGGSDSKESACNAGDLGSIPQLERSPGAGNGTTPVFLPGESHGQRSLADYSPWVVGSGTTWRLNHHHHHHHHVLTIMIPILQMKETEEQNGPCDAYREAQFFKGFSLQLPSPVSAFRLCLCYLAQGHELLRAACTGQRDKI